MEKEIHVYVILQVIDCITSYPLVNRTSGVKLLLHARRECSIVWVRVTAGPNQRL
jgi:hypothetical protein